MKKRFLLFVYFILIFTFNLASFEPKDFNGGWLTENNYKRLKNGDEFFVDQMRTINIDGIEYWYCLSGTLIDLSSSNPRFCITYFNDFDVLKIEKVSDAKFNLELRNRNDEKMIGIIMLTIKDSKEFYFEIIEGSDSFINEIKYFTYERNYIFHRLEQRK